MLQLDLGLIEVVVVLVLGRVGDVYLPSGYEYRSDTVRSWAMAWPWHHSGITGGSQEAEAEMRVTWR